MKFLAILLPNLFQNFFRVPIQERKNNPIFCVGLPRYGYPRACGSKKTKIKLHTLHDKDVILSLDNSVREGMSSFLRDRYATSDASNENKKILHINANDFRGWKMSQYLFYDEISFD